MSDQDDAPAAATGQAPTRRSTAERLRLAAAFGLGGLAVLFAVLNLDQVDVHWIVAVWRTPLIVVILVCVLVGMAIGLVLARRRA